MSYLSLRKFYGRRTFHMKNTTGTHTTSGAWTVYPSGVPEFIPPVFSVVCVAQFLFFCVVFLFCFYHCFSFCSLYFLSFYHWYLLNTPLVSSEYPIGIFWIPHWYLVNTPLVSSEYPIDIFWILHWYLLNTSLISSEYPIGIFNLFFKRNLNKYLKASTHIRILY